jgi:hypothetical protein
MHRTRFFAAAAVGGALALFPGVARADDHAVAQALAQQLDQDAVHRPFIADAIAHAHAALERATRLRAVDDGPHALEADAMAREWAEIARDRVGAADAEDKAADLRRRATEAQAQLERTRALVEQGIARVGRLQAELAETLRGAHTAVEVHDGSPALKKAADSKRPDASPKKAEDATRTVPPKADDAPRPSPAQKVQP